jgi:hypothetical protein
MEAMLQLRIALSLVPLAPSWRLPIELGHPVVARLLAAHGFPARNSATWRLQSDGRLRPVALLPVQPQTQRTIWMRWVYCSMTWRGGHFGGAGLGREFVKFIAVSREEADPACRQRR